MWLRGKVGEGGGREGSMAWFIALGRREGGRKGGEGRVSGEDEVKAQEEERMHQLLHSRRRDTNCGTPQHPLPFLPPTLPPSSPPAPA